MIDEIQSLLFQLAMLPMGSPEAQAIHDQIAELTERNKPYTVEDYEKDLREKFEPHGVRVNVHDHLQTSPGNLMVVTYRDGQAVAIQVSEEVADKDSIDFVFRALMERWDSLQ